jgi:hypothetical protein
MMPFERLTSRLLQSGQLVREIRRTFVGKQIVAHEAMFL